MKTLPFEVIQYSGQGQGTASQTLSLPIWLVFAGNLLMGASFWLIAAGGMVAKLILLGFWIAMLCGYARPVRITPGLLAGCLSLAGLTGVIATGNGASIEKLRLIGNLMMLPVGLLVGLLIGRDSLRVMMPVLVVYLLLSSSFQMTHEGMRLNQPFLFLGLFALCSVAGWRGCRLLVAGSALAVLLSQTRIAVLAMLVNLIGMIRFSRAMTWIVACVVLGLAGWFAMSHLPRLFLTHGSGRLAFWQDFWGMWQGGSGGQRWLGFGTGSVEEILSGYQSFASFGALHNDHFRMLFETGIVGLVLWAAGWIVMLWTVRHVRLAVCILLSVMLTMVTDNTLNYGHYLICCGMAAGIDARARCAHE
ncbi:MAG: polymerase [Thalassospira sp.]|uniref:O-antigen ligase family protein n=1 Tax=unclassified Thalassospira TaxID=2648997 RepID=UPI000C5A5A60|nr:MULTISPECIES: O-antigen ligase family protein [unclassified Thalassospira]MBE69614.1 polymerase [Thalassospira sp.]QPO12784.1 O-antigen ligase domain-containing protein [Thalassospira sp. A40-3]